jgi:peroxiredoxin
MQPSSRIQTHHLRAMRVSWPFVLLALVIGGMQLAGAATAVGKPAPDFSAVDSNGKMHTLKQYRGSLVVLEWTNDQCPFVRKHYGTDNMQALQREATAQGVVWLSVISSAPGMQGYVSGDEANSLTKQRKAAPTAVLLDPKGEVGHAYGAKTTPHMYIIDREGVLVYMGGIDDTPSTDWEDVKTAKNYVHVALNEIMAGQPVSNAVTRPYGCSVKYNY